MADLALEKRLLISLARKSFNPLAELSERILDSADGSVVNLV